MSNFSEILKQIDENIINEETAKAISEAFENAVNEKVESRLKLQVENALSNQDEEHAAKLEKLLEAIDNDHSSKLQEVVNAITENHADKLNKVASFYKKALNEKAENFSKNIINEMSNYLDLYLDKVLPKDQLEEAVKNIHARKKLDTIRELVGFDKDYVDSSVKESIMIGKEKIDELNTKLNESYKENETLLEKINGAEAKLLLQEKTSGMASSKKDFIFKLLNDKDSSYILENFNYVVEMFERGEEETAAELVEEAKHKAFSRDVKSLPVSVVNESFATDNNERDVHISEYLNELKRK
jgi:hypothetical protein